MKKVVVTGYATMDYVVQLQAQFHGTGTVLGELGPADAWPRAGGAALYASKRLAAAGHHCSALTWIGDDEDGVHFVSACEEAKIQRSAISQTSNGRTTRCIMIYNADGSSGCLLDIGPVFTPRG